MEYGFVMHRFFLFPLFPSILCCFVLLPNAGCHKAVEKPRLPEPEVVVESVVVRDVQPYIDATGHAEAFQYVRIPARVSGFLREIRFEPGSIVAAGTPLFLIEPDQYQAEVKAAEAQLATAEAQLKLCEANLARTKNLISQGALTEQDLDTDEAKRDEAAAAVLSAKANLATAQLNLSYTDVRSPVTGKVDRNLFDIGNMVGPDGDHNILTTVAGMDPIYIYFDISDYQFNNIRKFAKEKKDPAAEHLVEQLRKLKQARQDDVKAYQTSMGLVAAPKEEDEKSQAAAAPPRQEMNNVEIEFEVSLIKGASPNTGEYPYKGIIDMTGNKIDESTGTITIRGEIPNTDYTIFPGQICRIRIPVWEIRDAVLVKEEAIVHDLNQNYVFVVDDENVAHRRLVELGLPQPDGTRVVEAPTYRENAKTGEKTIVKGLEKNERYIVSGVQKARDGGNVKIVEPTFSTKQTARDKPGAEEKAGKEEKPEENPEEKKMEEPAPADNAAAPREAPKEKQPKPEG